MAALQLLASCTNDAACGGTAFASYGPGFAVVVAVLLMLAGTWYRHHREQEPRRGTPRHH